MTQKHVSNYKNKVKQIQALLNPAKYELKQIKPFNITSLQKINPTSEENSNLSTLKINQNIKKRMH